MVGLVASPERIVQIRQNRLLTCNADEDTAYVDRDAVAEEIANSRRLCARHNWPIHRRDPPFHRGDRRRDPRPLPRSPHALHRRVRMPSMSDRSGPGPRAALLLASTSADPARIAGSAPASPMERRSGRRRRARDRGWRPRRTGSTRAGSRWRLAAEKALAVSRRQPGRLVLGRRSGSRPRRRALSTSRLDRAEAQAHLRALAGRTHALHSAVALAQDGASVDVVPGRGRNSPCGASRTRPSTSISMPAAARR